MIIAMKYFFILIWLLLPEYTYSQDSSNHVYSKVYKAARLFEEVTVTIERGGSQVKLRDLAEQIKKYSFVPIPKGVLKGDIEKNSFDVTKHLVFLPEIIDSLASGHQGKSYALLAYRRFKQVKKGAQTTFADLCIETKMIKAKETHRFTINTRGIQDIAVVAEPYGRLSLLVRDMTHNRFKTEKEKETEGKIMRYLSYGTDLPSNTEYQLVIYIENKSTLDVSYAIILN